MAMDYSMMYQFPVWFELLSRLPSWKPEIKHGNCHENRFSFRIQFQQSPRKFSIFSVFSNFEKIRYCPHFVCPSVCAATTFQGVDRACSFMAQSIAYDPRAWTKEGFFFGPILAPTGGIRSPNSIHFHMKIRFYWYLLSDSEILAVGFFKFSFYNFLCNVGFLKNSFRVFP